MKKKKGISVIVNGKIIGTQFNLLAHKKKFTTLLNNNGKISYKITHYIIAIIVITLFFIVLYIII